MTQGEQSPQRTSPTPVIVGVVEADASVPHVLQPKSPRQLEVREQSRSHQGQRSEGRGLEQPQLPGERATTDPAALSVAGILKTLEDDEVPAVPRGGRIADHAPE